jgi:hypothetical protein
MMSSLDRHETLFVVWAFAFILILIAHFALRKWAFATAIQYGWIVYALGLVSAVVSVVIWRGGKPWFFWLGGFLCLAWVILGFIVEYVMHIEWREPILWQVFIPYIFLYLATLMFYWWPLARIGKPFWGIYTVLFIIATYLNTTSHHPS